MLVHESLRLRYFSHYFQQHLRHIATHTSSSWLRCSGAHCLGGFQVCSGEDTLGSDVVSHADLQEVVGDFIVFFDLFDVVSNNCPFFFEDADGAVDSHIDILSFVEILERNRDFVFSLLVKDHFVGTSGIVKLKNCAHVFMNDVDDSADHHDLNQSELCDTYVCNLLPVNFNHFVGAKTCLANHLDRQRSKDSWFSPLVSCSSVIAVCKVIVKGIATLRLEEPSLVVSELQSSGKCAYLPLFV